MAELSQFAVSKMYEERLTSDHLMRCVSVLMVVKEKILAMAKQRLGIELEKAMQKIKDMNHERPESKLYLSFLNGKQKVTSNKEMRRSLVAPKIRYRSSLK